METKSSEKIVARIMGPGGIMVDDWMFEGSIGDNFGPEPRSNYGVLVSGCPLNLVVNKVTGEPKPNRDTPAADYTAYAYAYPPGNKASITVTAFVGDDWYQSTFPLRIVTREAEKDHDGATPRSVGVAALAGIAAVLLMG